MKSRGILELIRTIAIVGGAIVLVVSTIFGQKKIIKSYEEFLEANTLE